MCVLNIMNVLNSTLLQQYINASEDISCILYNGVTLFKT